MDLMDEDGPSIVNERAMIYSTYSHSSNELWPGSMRSKGSRTKDSHFIKTCASYEVGVHVLTCLWIDDQEEKPYDNPEKILVPKTKDYIRLWQNFIKQVQDVPWHTNPRGIKMSPETVVSGFFIRYDCNLRIRMWLILYRKNENLQSISWLSLFFWIKSPFQRQLTTRTHFSTSANRHMTPLLTILGLTRGQKNCTEEWIRSPSYQRVIKFNTNVNQSPIQVHLTGHWYLRPTADADTELT